MKDAMISIGARSWSFPGARIDTDSWEAEWHSDGSVCLHDGGKVVEGIEVDNPEVLTVVPLPHAAERRRRETIMNGIEIAVSMMDGSDVSEHRRRELALVRLMAVAIDVLLNTGEDALDIRIETARDIRIETARDIRIETARDMIREIKNVYPETCDV